MMTRRNFSGAAAAGKVPSQMIVAVPLVWKVICLVTTQCPGWTEMLLMLNGAQACRKVRINQERFDAILRIECE